MVCAELLGKKVDMHKYAIQITVADTRDGACSSSTLKEASSWGKVDVTKEQMVFAEATSVLPLIASDAYHRKHWQSRQKKFSKFIQLKYKMSKTTIALVQMKMSSDPNKNIHNAIKKINIAAKKEQKLFACQSYF